MITIASTQDGCDDYKLYLKLSCDYFILVMEWDSLFVALRKNERANGADCNSLNEPLKDRCASFPVWGGVAKFFCYSF